MASTSPSWFLLDSCFGVVLCLDLQMAKVVELALKMKINYTTLFNFKSDCQTAMCDHVAYQSHEPCDQRHNFW